jgi:hypothetical protein
MQGIAILPGSKGRCRTNTRTLPVGVEAIQKFCVTNLVHSVPQKMLASNLDLINTKKNTKQQIGVGEKYFQSLFFNCKAA